MKKITIFSLFLGALFFYSCKKCQTCTTTTTQNIGFFPTSVSVSEEYCGNEYDNAPAEVSFSQEVAGVSQSVEVSCVDN